MRLTRRQLALEAGAALAAPTLMRSAWADTDPGITDTEIKLGQTMPFSGPASAYSAFGKSMAGYMTMTNERGGRRRRRGISATMRQTHVAGERLFVDYARDIVRCLPRPRARMAST